MARPTTPPHHHHHDRVQLQRKVHDARRLLLEAADHLLDVDLATRADDAHRAEVARRQAESVTLAAKRQIEALDDANVTITVP